VTNCILWDGGDEIWHDDGSTITVTYSDIQGGYPGAGNIDADPLFLDAPRGNIHLSDGSPCIDSGDNAAVAVSIDFERDDRPLDGDHDGTATVDMGADEYRIVPLADLAITGPTTGSVHVGYAFTAVVSPITATQPITYTWQATDQSPVIHTGSLSDTTVFTWAGPGTQAITVTAANIGGPVSDTHTVTVYTPVQAAFVGSPTSGVAPLMVVFTNLSTGDYTSSLWDLGDGITSTLENPPHVYTGAGVYTVTLSVSGPGGNSTEVKVGYISVRKYNIYLPLIIK